MRKISIVRKAGEKYLDLSIRKPPISKLQHKCVPIYRGERSVILNIGDSLLYCHPHIQSLFSNGVNKTKKPIPFLEMGSHFSPDHMPTLWMVKGFKDVNAWPLF